MSYISLPYPWIPDVPSNINEDLKLCHREHLQLHAMYGETGRKTRQSSELISARIIELWREPWVQRWLKDPIKCDAIVNWLRQAIYVDIDQPPAEALNFFLSVQVLISYGDITLALQELTSWQKQIALNLFNRQKNLALDLMNEVEDELQDLQDSDLDGDSDEDFYADKDEAPVDDFQTHRQNYRQSQHPFQQFPLYRDPSPNKSTYVLLCQQWSMILRDHLLTANMDKMSAKNLEIGHREVARTIQAMKKIRKSTYIRHDFAMAVSTSGLAQTIIELTNRSAYYDKPHQATYSRRFGFALVLGANIDCLCKGY
ncbi:hypothetical protein F5051DRAFT_400743 [Lentinula edodes]|nr:hypothetical protein F5051DRAFT_400743 [Lentinula edodes]